MRLYLDTAPVIYVVEQVPDFSQQILHYIQKPDIELVVSDLTWMECRVKPLAENNETLLADYDKFFSQLLWKLSSFPEESWNALHTSVHNTTSRRPMPFIWGQLLSQNARYF